MQTEEDRDRETPMVRDPRADLPTEPPPPARTRSGELLAVIRAPSEHPQDPAVVRIDQWGEVLLARIEETATTANDARATSARASKDNVKQDAAIGVLVADMVGVKADVATIKSENATGVALAQLAVDKLSKAVSPQLATTIGTLVTIAVGALIAWAKGKGYL